MQVLLRLLTYLEQEHVTELQLQTDKEACVLQNGNWVNITKAGLSTQQIQQIIEQTPIAATLQTLGDLRCTADVVLNQQTYHVQIQRLSDHLRLTWSKPAKTATSQPQPLPQNPVTSTSAPQSVAGHSAPQHIDPKLVALLALARQKKASDIHIFAGQPARIRVVGELLKQGETLSPPTVQAMLESIIQKDKLHDLQAQGYVDISLQLPQVGRFRVNIGMQSTGYKGCFRLVVSDVPTLAELGLPKELADVVNYHQGLAIISGPTGQGKTTTMAAIVDLVNKHSHHHIITVEDPIEIVHPKKQALISQREVGAHTKSFKRALKAALREDPDVIVIGELRDRETVEIALSAAETGHLVIATMSTRSGAKTIDRLIDMFPPDDQNQVRATLAGALKIIVSQRLLPNSQANGMVAAAELITGSVPLWSLIRENKLFQLPSLQQRGRGMGMIRFDTSLLELVRANKITIQTAKQAADNLVEFERSLKEGTV